MLTLLTIGIVIAVAAIAIVVTLNALATAPDGFEDESGFHVVSPVANSDRNRLAGNTAGATSAKDLTSFAAYR